MKKHFFGKGSEAHLEKLEKRTREFLRYALFHSPVDFSVTDSYRGEKLQNLYFRTGASQVFYPNSLHNKTDKEGKPASTAFHLLPAPARLPIPGYDIWKDRERLTYLAGIIVGLGSSFRLAFPTLDIIGIRWGGDWDNDGILNRWDGHSLDDLCHFETLFKTED